MATVASTLEWTGLVLMVLEYWDRYASFRRASRPVLSTAGLVQLESQWGKKKVQLIKLDNSLLKKNCLRGGI